MLMYRGVKVRVHCIVAMAKWPKMPGSMVNQHRSMANMTSWWQIKSMGMAKAILAKTQISGKMSKSNSNHGYGKDHSGHSGWYAHAHVVPIHHEEPR